MSTEKKALRRLFRFLVLGPLVVFALFMVAAVGVAIFGGTESKTTPEDSASVSPERWKTHDETLRGGTRIVLLKITNNDIAGLYSFAVKQKEIQNTEMCRLDGCSEYRGLMRAVERAAGDGILTPADVNEITENARLVKQVLDQGAGHVREVSAKGAK